MITTSRQRRLNALGTLFAMVFVVHSALANERFSADSGTTRTMDSREFQISAGVFKGDIGQRYKVAEVPLMDDLGLVTLEIERFRVFAPDATIVLHTAVGDEFHPFPKNSYYRGRVAGEPGSTVVMTALEGGEVRGLVALAGRYWVFSGASLNKAMPANIRIREVDHVVELEHDVQGFECGADRLHAPPRDDSVDAVETPRAIDLKAAAYTARIAVESDNEFFNLFGNTTDAANYVADIIAFGSAIYSAEVSTSWVLQHLSLWSQGQQDPWTQTAPDCGLYEFGRYWNDSHQGISRTTAAFFSGKSIAGGIAWTGVLCYGPFNVNLGQSCPALTPTDDNYGGEYAFIGGMNGSFDINNPGAVWDIVAVTHEIGHNFNSPHTHCYAGVGGNANQIDQCYSGDVGLGYTCYSGGTSLPSGCPGSGNGCGTIMSYCHQRTGGLSNMSLTLGQSHPYGIAPDRVPSHMSTHVVSQAALNPGCLEYVNLNDIFADGFDSGDTTAWGGTVP